MRKDMTIAELVDAMTDRCIAAGEDLDLSDNAEFRSMMRINTIRLVSIIGIMDGRDKEVFDYLSELTKEDSKKLLMILREKKSEDRK